jgi:hypothetical protein
VRPIKQKNALLCNDCIKTHSCATN